MTGTERVTRATIVGFSAIVEAGTGVGLALAPAVVLPLLLGGAQPTSALAVGRVAGVALWSLAIATWPGRDRAAASPSGARAMLVYNGLVGLFLAYLGAAGQATGLLLWPAAALHVVVALFLLWRSSGP